jgi:hypothetical protein
MMGLSELICFKRGQTLYQPKSNFLDITGGASPPRLVFFSSLLIVFITIWKSIDSNIGIQKEEKES